MNKYMKLVRFELNRFWNFYLILIGITVALQLTGVFVLSKKYIAQANQIMYENALSQPNFLRDITICPFISRLLVVYGLWGR